MMRMTSMTRPKIAMILIAAMAAAPIALPAQQSTTPSGQTANPPQQTAPQPKAKKKPDEPIDPDATAGVRGSGTTHTVRVLHKDKPVQGAHVVVKNLNGSLVASCYTNASGECDVELGADSYIFKATKNERAGTVTQPVTETSGPIRMKLHKIEAEDSVPKS